MTNDNGQENMNFISYQPCRSLYIQDHFSTLLLPRNPSCFLNPGFLMDPGSFFNPAPPPVSWILYKTYSIPYPSSLLNPASSPVSRFPFSILLLSPF